MGNKKYYRKNYNNNNNNKKNYYFKNKKYNHKDNNYQYDNSQFDVNRIEELVNNNLGDDKINNNEFKEEEFIPKKKDNHDFSLDDIQKDVYKLSKTESLGVDVNTDDLKDEIEVEIKKKPRKNLLIKTSFGYALGIIILLLAIVGTTYSYFNYTRESTQADIVTGNIYVKVVEDTVNLNNKLYPTTKEAARSKTDNVVTFTVKGLNTSDKTIYYEIKLNYGDSKTGTRFNDKDLVFDLIEVGQNNEETYRANAKSFSDIANGARVWVDTIPAGTTEEITKTYKLRMWLSDKVTIDDDNGTYPASTYNTYYASIKASVYGDFQVKEPPLTGTDKVLKAITSNATGTCQDIIYEEDDIKYFSGTNDCINFNYVWYSGKLWRITAIYPDGSMKLITENMITSIAFNESGQVNFYTDANTTSYMYQWLNEDFYDTLYNASEFIDTSKQWNATMPADTKISTKPGNTNLVTANVGLLNNYEFYNSYRNLDGFFNGYLNKGYYWWLLNPYNASNVWNVHNRGSGSVYDPTRAYGGRPSIYLKSGVVFTGSGTKDNPYKIVGDKDAGSVNDYVNTRLSGEYVKLKNGSNEQLFRIIDVEDNKTKIIAMDYADNKGTRKFATNTGSVNALWGSGTTTGTNTWYTYLNNTYLPNLKTTYNELFDSGTYYLGTSGYNYKLSVCANSTSGSTKECAKTTQSGTFNIGLPRYGEMFATQQSGGTSNSIGMWLMNRYISSYVWIVRDDGYGSNYDPSGATGGRPTLHLKSTVKILTCDSDICDGTQNHPYVVGL